MFSHNAQLVGKVASGSDQVVFWYTSVNKGSIFEKRHENQRQFQTKDPPEKKKNGQKLCGSQDFSDVNYWLGLFHHQ